MKPLAQEWETYVHQGYGGSKLGRVQYEEVKQAFFAGAWMALLHAFKVIDGELTPEDKSAALKQLYQETEDENWRRAKELTEREKHRKQQQ